MIELSASVNEWTECQSRETRKKIAARNGVPWIRTLVNSANSSDAISRLSGSFDNVLIE